MAFDDDLAGRVRHILATEWDGAEEIRMMGALCFMRSGHMCCGVTGDRLMVRLGKEGAAEALTDPDVAPLEVGGGRSPMSFVTVSPSAVQDADKLGNWIARAVRFTQTLPPKKKPQRRK